MLLVYLKIEIYSQFLFPCRRAAQNFTVGRLYIWNRGSKDVFGTAQLHELQLCFKNFTMKQLCDEVAEFLKLFGLQLHELHLQLQKCEVLVGNVPYALGNMQELVKYERNSRMLLKMSNKILCTLSLYYFIVSSHFNILEPKQKIVNISTLAYPKILNFCELSCLGYCQEKRCLFNSKDQ